MDPFSIRTPPNAPFTHPCFHAIESTLLVTRPACAHGSLPAAIVGVQLHNSEIRNSQSSERERALIVQVLARTNYYGAKPEAEWIPC
jgi:hypothetical protein